LETVPEVVTVKLTEFVLELMLVVGIAVLVIELGTEGVTDVVNDDDHVIGLCVPVSDLVTNVDNV